jgi:type IV pilus assembly protein PilB
MRRTPLGQILIQDGHLDEHQLQSAIAHQNKWGGRIGEALVAMGFVKEQVMLRTVARQLGVPFMEIGHRRVAPAIVQLLPAKLIRRRRLLPVALLGTKRGPLIVAFADPANLSTIDEASFAAGMPVRPVLAGELDLERAIARNLDDAAHDWMQPVEVPADPGPMRLTGSYWS